MLRPETNWVVRLAGRAHAVKVTVAFLSMSFYVDGVLADKLNPGLAYPHELARYQKDGHTYVLRLKGWWAFVWLELEVDGLVIEPTKAGSSAAPTSGAETGVAQEQRIELVETERTEQLMAEDRKVIDNSNGSQPVQRKITMTKEWTQTITIENEKAASLKGSAGGSLWGVEIKVEAEARIRERYSTSTETMKRYTDETTITVPAKTRTELIFAWKQVWQCGIIRVHAPDGSTVELPYRLALEPTFDQRRVDTPAQVTRKDRPIEAEPAKKGVKCPQCGAFVPFKPGLRECTMCGHEF